MKTEQEIKAVYHRVLDLKGRMNRLVDDPTYLDNAVNKVLITELLNIPRVLPQSIVRSVGYHLYYFGL